MANRRLIAAMREAAAAGWHRDVTYRRRRDGASSTLDAMMLVWREPENRLLVVLEPGALGHAWATVRVLQFMHLHDRHDWVCIADCKVGDARTALRVLHAFGIVSAEAAR